MNLTESIGAIIRAEAEELEAQGEFELIDKREWAMARYRELYDEAIADRVDDFFENEWRWSIIEDEAESANAELYAMIQEFRDSYAANEWGDELWEAGIDPWAGE